MDRRDRVVTGVDMLTVPFPIATYRSNAVRSRAGDEQARRVVDDLRLVLGGPDTCTTRLPELVELGTGLSPSSPCRCP